MTTARSELVDVEATPYYHCMARCVRRAYLCGDDEYSGRSFDHRKTWIVERIKLLASLFAIDVCAYAILSNHLHLILRIMAALVARWSDEEVLTRVRQLCPTCVEGLERWTAEQREKLVATWRARFCDISWFMAKLDEYVARRANEEDGCTGRFWEGRFKSQALLDEGALLTCMSYVDLNPVRAGIAQGLDDSSWTSIQQRLREAAASLAREKTSEEPRDTAAVTQTPTDAPQLTGASRQDATRPVASRDGSQPEPELWQCPTLAPMDDEPRGGPDRLPLSLLEYVALLEWTGRAIRDDKFGHITAPPPRLLAAVGLDPDGWLASVERFGALGGFVGHPARLRRRAQQVGRRWLKGQGGSAMAYSMAA